MGNSAVVKMRVGRYYVNVRVEFSNDRIFFEFPFNRELMDIIKTRMSSPRWHGFDEKPRKCWSAKADWRTIWWYQYLTGENPYAIYDKPIIDHSPPEDFWRNQKDIFNGIMTYRCHVIAGEMGTGKTRPCLEVIKRVLEENGWEQEDVLWLGTVATLTAVELEMYKWKFPYDIPMMTHDSLRNKIIRDKKKIRIPKMLFIDEASRVKNPQAGRSKACQIVADQMRAKHDKIYIVPLSGTPSPKSPVDWWSIAEITQPGFLVERNTAFLQNRLSFVEQEMSAQGQTFPKIKAWKDGGDICGHETVVEQEYEAEYTKKFETKTYCCLPKADHLCLDHPFVPVKNEVANLFKRMRGLTQVHFKKDCLDLPDIHEIFFLYNGKTWKQTTLEQLYDGAASKVDPSTLRAAKMIVDTNKRAITALSKLRELSDGFQYTKKPTGAKVQCPGCNGTGEQTGLVFVEDLQENMEITGECVVCSGAKEVDEYERVAVRVHCPKDLLLKHRLSLHEEYGRFVVCAAYQAAVDRATDVVLSEGWHVLKADSRGWKLIRPDKTQVKVTKKQMLLMFSRDLPSPDLLCVVGHPGTMGMGLNLQASAELHWYSMPFGAEDVAQAKHRIHRGGMDFSRGCTVSYAFYLNTDFYVFKAVQKKLDLQAQTMGEFRKQVGNYE